MGFDGIPSVYDYILDDEILASIDVEATYQGKTAFRAALGKFSRRVPPVEPKVLAKAADKERTWTNALLH